MQSLFFQQLSYLMYDVHAKTAPKSLLDKFAKINTKKIKSLLLNVLGNEDSYLNFNYLIEYFMK